MLRGPVTKNIITRGWADPQNADSLSESEPLEPGEFVELSFDLQPDDQVIKAGQRIGRREHLESLVGRLQSGLGRLPLADLPGHRLLDAPPDLAGRRGRQR